MNFVSTSYSSVNGDILQAMLCMNGSSAIGSDVIQLSLPCYKSSRLIWVVRDASRYACAGE
eukprot:scaffold385_cov305-Pinguiococcus_pyrenoidosus.AAC.36